MRLELASFSVKDVRFAKQTGYKNGVLTIDKEELLGLIMGDKKVASADLDVTFPGEQTRIVRIRDIVEPRVKVSGPGSVFPGILEPAETVGEGRTHRFLGVTVTVSANYTPMVKSGTGGQTSGVVDMWGPGARLSPFGNIIHIVLIIKLMDGLTEQEAHTAIQAAEVKAAKRLAETTRTLTPEDIEVFELFSVDASLPKVIYDASFITTWHEPQTEVLYYGMPIRESLSTLIHPNELLDGALTVDARRGNGLMPRTWEWMNNPIVLGLLREHGKRVNFLGVILQRTRFEAEWCKRIGAECASQLARLLHADGVIMTKTNPSGNNAMDVMFTVQAFEKKGLKTILVTPEHGGPEGIEPALWFFAPEANAIISTGARDRATKLPVPNKVIGCEKGELVAPNPDPGVFISPWGELELERKALIPGSIDYFGYMHQTCILS